jgi:pantoate--beta-alanine ligase
MRVVKSVKQMQRLALEWRRRGSPVGFVPTMGYLHAGHISLVKRARAVVGPRGIVVVSIYVNPTQFAPTEDLSRYPRDFARDSQMCRDAGVDVIFCPSDGDMYPGKADGLYSTFVVEEALSQRMEGASRPTHFRGVTTIVAKLFNIVQPDVSVFGAKDFQQAAIIRRMVADLNMAVRIIVAPTVREPDGLAMSSRNKYLTPEQRTQATVLSRAIAEARASVRRGPQPAGRLKQSLSRFIAREPLARLDYIDIFDPDTLLPVKVAQRGAHLALAVFFGHTRLIDNGRF